MAIAEPLEERLREMVAQDPSQGYRALHAKLKEEEGFKDISLKKVQVALAHVKEGLQQRRASPGENVWTAASDGDMARVEELMICEGFTPTSPDENGYTPIHAAASWGRVELLRALLQRDPAGANIKDQDGDTPLHHVAMATELAPEETRSVVELLLAHGANPKLQNAESRTCLDTCGEKVLDMDEDEEPPPDQEVEINLEFVKVMADNGHVLE
mmetsp:Transcript_10565/g.17274  ORF Transcript_10565/g.17274 Transcript_10565/m.17274 type:complete len:214 (+) Transcript_10565:67-708(+)